MFAVLLGVYVGVELLTVIPLDGFGDRQIVFQKGLTSPSF